MKILDKIALERLISMILNFLLTIIKLFIPITKNNKNIDDKKIWRPRWRKGQ